MKRNGSDGTVAEMPGVALAPFAGILLVAAFFVLAGASWSRRPLEAMTLPDCATSTAVFAPEEGHQYLSIMRDTADRWVVELKEHDYDLKSQASVDKFRGLLKRTAINGRSYFGDRICRTPFVIRADQDAPVELVFAVRNVCAECGIRNVTFATSFPSEVH